MRASKVIGALAILTVQAGLAIYFWDLRASMNGTYPPPPGVVEYYRLLPYDILIVLSLCVFAALIAERRERRRLTIVQFIGMLMIFAALIGLVIFVRNQSAIIAPSLRPPGEEERYFWTYYHTISGRSPVNTWGDPWKPCHGVARVPAWQ